MYRAPAAVAAATILLASATGSAFALNPHIWPVIRVNGISLVSGTSKAAVIRAPSGDVTVHAHQGNDVVYGGAGKQKITPGSGQDRVITGRGTDTIYAVDHERDTIICGSSKNIVYADKIDTVSKNCGAVYRR